MIYEYNCSKCGQFDATNTITGRDKMDCPKCGGPVKRVEITKNTSFQLLGSGWTPKFGK